MKGNAKVVVQRSMFQDGISSHDPQRRPTVWMMFSHEMVAVLPQR
jgi:hypothetical protein